MNDRDDKDEIRRTLRYDKRRTKWIWRSRDDDTYDPHESTKKFGGVSDLFTS